MKTSQKKKNKIGGYSLIEMVLAVAISAIIALAVGQIFLSGMKSTERNRKMQKNLEESRSVMETMAKNIRMSKYLKKSVSGDIISLYMYNFSQGKCISYSVDNLAKVLKYAECNPNVDPQGKIEGADNDTACESGVSCDDPYIYTQLSTGDNINGDFDVTQTSRTSGSEVIGKATIRLTVGAGTDKEEHLQTSVSFRDYDDIIQYK